LPKFEIKHRKSGAVIFEGKANSLKELVQSAVISGTDTSLSQLVVTRLGLKKKTKVRLYGADLHGADLSEIDLTGADLSGADLSECNLAGSCLKKAILARCSLSKADLSRTTLSETDFSEADISGANLRKAQVDSANFSEALLAPCFRSRSVQWRRFKSAAIIRWPWLPCSRASTRPNGDLLVCAPSARTARQSRFTRAW